MSVNGGSKIKGAKGFAETSPSNKSLLLSSGSKSRSAERSSNGASTKERPLTAKDLMEIVTRRAKEPRKPQPTHGRITTEELFEIFKNGDNRRGRV